MIIQINGIDINTYRENPWMAMQAPVCCPFCESRICRNGSYERGPMFFHEVFRLRIFRKYCSRCAIAFTLLPHFLLPRHRHMKIVISSWLWACLTTSLLCRDYLRPLVPEPSELSQGAKGASYTDHFDSCVVRPGRTLIHYWLKAFSARASRTQAALVVSCIAAGRDLTGLPRIAGAIPSGLRRKAAPLVLALCLCALLLASHSLDLVFDRLLVFLLGP